MDEAVQTLLHESEIRADKIIGDHRPGLERLIAKLEEHETLYREQIEECLRGDTTVSVMTRC